MIRITQIKMPIKHSGQELKKKVLSILHIGEPELLSLNIVKRSVDARKKPQLFFMYTVDAAVKNEERILRHLPKNCAPADDRPYRLPESNSFDPVHKPVIVGDGPAGLFCAYLFAQCGIPAILIERGQPVEDRVKAVEDFWKNGILMPDSNVQFGEGGAGTFSDGKLNTLVKDKTGKNRFVLETFVKFGAPEEILYEAKPHIGTDHLQRIIRNMREHLIRHGIEVRFNTKMTGLQIKDGAVTGVEMQNGAVLPTAHVILAIGHSARDTFEMLDRQGVHMESKAFAVGLRVEHPRKYINESQYGTKEHDALKAASYKLTAQADNGRGVYSFCMCPGGYVVNASSEENRLAVNGMSYYDRNADNSNSAVIVTVTPDDFEGSGTLSGVAFQRKLEEKAYNIGGGAVPVQTFGAFENAVIQGGLRAGQKQDDEAEKELQGQTHTDLMAEMKPCIKGKHVFSNVHEILPEDLNRAFIDGMHQFGQKIKGFDDPRCLLSGVESRTSSPVRINRTESGESVNIKGLFPCGEGAGYAGGIMSAAMDGLNIAEKIIRSKEEEK